MCIESALPGSTVVMEDPRGDGVHLRALVTSEQFRGMPLLKQHKLVMNALAEMFSHDLHALEIKTMFPNNIKHMESIH